jgi:hypothetical protein
MLPGLMFTHGDPLLLTEDGEFVMKNLVLIGATLAVMAHAPTRPRGHGRGLQLAALARAAAHE